MPLSNLKERQRRVHLPKNKRQNKRGSRRFGYLSPHIPMGICDTKNPIFLASIFHQHRCYGEVRSTNRWYDQTNCVRSDDLVYVDVSHTILSTSTIRTKATKKELNQFNSWKVYRNHHTKVLGLFWWRAPMVTQSLWVMWCTDDRSSGLDLR